MSDKIEFNNTDPKIKVDNNRISKTISWEEKKQKQKKILVSTRIDEDVYKEFASKCDDEGCIVGTKIRMLIYKYLKEN